MSDQALESEQPVGRYVHGMFCDDIRDEVGGSTSIIGAFNGPVKIDAEMPAIIPRLAALVWIVAPLGDIRPDVEIFAELPGGQVLAMPPISADEVSRVQSQQPDIAGATRQMARATIRMTDVVISKPGRIVLKVRAWGKTWTAASLAIIAAA